MYTEDKIFFGLVVGFFTGIAFLISGLTTGADTDYWEQIDDHGDCYVHVTKVNNVWFTPGISGPEMRLQFCRR